jgi:hypothetical protein
MTQNLKIDLSINVQIDDSVSDLADANGSEPNSCCNNAIPEQPQ